MTQPENHNLPQHVAIVMDGNRRWARQRGYEAVEGHDYAAMHVIEPIITHSAKLGIPYLTFWAFSTENWKRDEEEINALFSIFRKGLSQLAIKLVKNGARIRLLGDVNKFPSDIVDKVNALVNKSQSNNKITVTFALNYGGRDEILRAVKKIIQDNVKPAQLDEAMFSSYLDTKGIPDPDLIIRTGGEQRLSGYLPWQSVYAELLFVSTLFPDFNISAYQQALDEYTKRDRRFGGNTINQPSRSTK